MLGIVQIERKVWRPERVPIARLWLVFFSDGESPAWWHRFLRPGFRHVIAVAWFGEQKRWVYFNPSWKGAVLELYRQDEFDIRFGHLMRTSSAVLRVRSGFDRNGMPAAAYCVGAIKALLGLHCRALLPHGLYRHLLANGAEIVEAESGAAIQTGRTARGSGACEGAQA